MTTFPGSPRLLKGALVSVDLPNPMPTVIIFQYNPLTLRRSLSTQTNRNGSKKAKPEVLRLKGAPKETISLDVEIDATDQLERGNGLAARLGIYPQLSALEMLLYPRSGTIIANTALTMLGMLEMTAPEMPLTLFIWGAKRVLPVHLQDFTITEQAYDAHLNPIRAKIPLSLRVLTYDDFGWQHPGYYLFLGHQVVKETMATIGTTNNISAVAGGNIELLNMSGL